MIRPNRLGHRTKTSGLQAGCQLASDIRDQSWPAVDQRGIQLHQRGAGAYPRIRIRTGGDAAAAVMSRRDDGDQILRHVNAGLKAFSIDVWESELDEFEIGRAHV